MTSRPQLRVVAANEHPAPRIDTDSAIIVGEAVDALAALRTPYWLGDAAVRLHALTSLIQQAEQLLPDAVHDARDQGLTWHEIGHLLNLTPATAARRYRHPNPIP
jgi:hypothetical protein